MRVVGVDPGSVVAGFGVVDGTAQHPVLVAAGTIRVASLKRGPARLNGIYRRLIEVIDHYRPQAMSLERSFVAVNAQSAFRLGEARAVAMLAAAERNLEFFEYTPAEVKMAVASHGRADKGQVKAMVRRALGLDAGFALEDDSADALALAVCHLIRARFDAAARGESAPACGRD